LIFNDDQYVDVIIVMTTYTTPVFVDVLYVDLSGTHDCYFSLVIPKGILTETDRVSLASITDTDQFEERKELQRVVKESHNGLGFLAYCLLQAAQHPNPADGTTEYVNYDHYQGRMTYFTFGTNFLKPGEFTDWVMSIRTQIYPH
jgi:hypothetical protein